jgi:hypothetical protein
VGKPVAAHARCSSDVRLDARKFHTRCLNWTGEGIYADVSRVYSGLLRSYRILTSSMRDRGLSAAVLRIYLNSRACKSA